MVRIPSSSQGASRRMATVRQKGTDAELWRQKIEMNRARDADTNVRLRESGWTVLRFWRHESTLEAADVIVGMVGAARERRIR